MPLDLEAELDGLYAAELADFVDERKRIARALKQEGRKAEAAGVEELRKPSLPAWTVNQLARRKRKDLSALVAAGERLGDAQQALLAGGGRAAFTEARRSEQDALRQLRDDAAWILGKRATDATLDRVVSTLGAAAVTAEGRAQLAEGRLVADVAPQGFDAFAAVAPADAPRTRKPAPAKRAAREPAVDRRKAKQEAIALARETLAAARAHETELADERRRAERAAAEARKAFDAAERKAERLRAEHEAATETVASARRELDAAKKA